MTTQWLRKTNKGRVVYERRSHTFSAADVNRVHRGWIDQATIPEAFDILTAIGFTTVAAAEKIGDKTLAYQAMMDHIVTMIRWFSTEFDPLNEQVYRRLYAIAKELKEWIEFMFKAYNLTL
jgi:hypothetical protein